MSLQQARQELHEAQVTARDTENLRGSLVVRLAEWEEQLEAASTGASRRQMREEVEKTKDSLADAAHAVTVAKQAEKNTRARVEAAEVWPKQRRFQIDELRRFLRNCENSQWRLEERVKFARRDLLAAEQALADLLRERDDMATKLAALEAEEQSETAPQAA